MLLTRSKRNWRAATMACLAIAASSAVFAQSEQGDSRIAPKALPQATLEAQAYKEVRQDTVTITLAKEVSDPSQAAIIKALSDSLESVMKDAKAADKVESRSGNYRIWPHHNDKGAITNWRGRAEIILTSKDFEAASELAGQLSDRMPVAGIQFSVASETRAKYEQELLADAAQAFKDRAQALAGALGFESFSIKEINLGGFGQPYQPAPRMMAMAVSADESRARVPIEPGTEQVTVTMQGTIFLRSTEK